ncbi:TonB-dependent receptor [Parabacteroides sp. PF5-6]|uniref:TonB-dependent receptor n=1 Tax=Parabacteroides sp. PF5-6 TaxID=1742403 RepID=UPI0024063A36|nr:TonB-dependent receptor [Parabacteroides sp. PF5-6]MDF9829697.1 hypothetical protein [Parabacteroides sp. PF5-6]
MKRLLTILVLVGAFVFPLSAQQIRLQASDTPLDQVLSTLNVELSFDSKALSVYRVSVNRDFSSFREAIDFLLQGKPFVCEQIGKVYVIVPYEEEVIAPVPIPETYTLSGVLTDKDNGERLPYAHILTAQGMIVGDENGFFSVKSNRPVPLRMRFTYLGYHPVDTLLMPGSHVINLSSQPMVMDEVFVSPAKSAMMMQTGRTSGEVRVNHAITRYMPGSGDNSVFNLLRMMPGVRASGEPNEELIVWGSESGESKITFDGYTLFGLKSFSDNISFINPYMVKEIRLNKGGMDASEGNRIGATGHITGVDGNLSAPSFKANVSNLTANLFGSLPVTKRSVLMVGYRQTYYNLYDVEKLNPYGNSHGNTTGGNGNEGNGNGGKGHGSGSGQGPGSGQGSQAGNNDFYIYPDYAFRDVNVKYSGSFSDRDKYALSFYAADDDFDFTVAQDNDFNLDAAEKSHQQAGSFAYDRMWNNTSKTGIQVSFSRLKTKEDLISSVQGNQAVPEIASHSENRISEVTARLNHSFPLGYFQQLEAGGEFTHYTDELNGVNQKLSKPTLYVTDRFTLGNLSLNAGLRTDFIPGKAYFQPRASLRYRINKDWTGTASWGLYRQYIAHIPVEDEAGNFVFAWQIQEDNAPSSMQSAAGIAFNRNGLLISAEGYHKKNKDVVRISDAVYRTDVDMTGFDVFLKKEFDKVSLFGSYSLSHLSEQVTETGHELKAGTILSFSPFTFSANYVFGSGFSYPYIGGHGIHGTGTGQGQSNNHADMEKNYSRLDVAATYSYSFPKLKLQTGLSIINVLGTENIKYAYRLPAREDVTNVFTQAQPFTPTLFIEIIF